MVVVPFVFFSALTLYWWHKHQALDVCVYMAALYAFTSLLAVVIVAGGMLGEGGILFHDSDLVTGVIPTLCYCLFIGVSILPFSMLYKRDLKAVTSRMPLVIDALCVVLILEALLNLYLVADSTYEILTGDLSTIRSDHYEGILSPADVKAESMPFPIRVFRYLNSATILALPIWFYNITMLKRPWWYNALLLFTSLSMPLAGIQCADRTECTYYALMAIFCYLLFGKFLTRKVKRQLMALSVALGVMVVAYLAAVSLARFEDRDGGAGESAIQYVGQGYLNFCYFYEHADPDMISTEREFPLINHFILGVDCNPERRSKRSGEQGFFISVFPSFVGDLLLDLSLLGMSVWVLYYFLLCCLLIRCAHRAELDISEVLVIFVAAAVPTFGIFYYRLYNSGQGYMVVAVALTYLLSQRKWVYR